MQKHEIDHADLEKEYFDFLPGKRVLKPGKTLEEFTRQHDLLPGSIFKPPENLELAAAIAERRSLIKRIKEFFK
jgi:hypothetical protein